MSISETRSGWSILLAGATVSQIQIDFRLGLTLSDGQQRVQVVIETPLVLLDSGKEDQTIYPGRSESLASVPSIFNRSVTSIFAGKDGQLDLEFAGGSRILVAPSPSYESWQVSSEGRYLLLCGPGGNVEFFKR